MPGPARHGRRRRAAPGPRRDPRPHRERRPARSAWLLGARRGGGHRRGRRRRRGGSAATPADRRRAAGRQVTPSGDRPRAPPSAAGAIDGASDGPTGGTVARRCTSSGTRRRASRSSASSSASTPATGYAAAANLAVPGAAGRPGLPVPCGPRAPPSSAVSFDGVGADGLIQVSAAGRSAARPAADDDRSSEARAGPRSSSSTPLQVRGRRPGAGASSCSTANRPTPCSASPPPSRCQRRSARRARPGLHHLARAGRDGRRARSRRRARPRRSRRTCSEELQRLRGRAQGLHDREECCSSPVAVRRSTLEAPPGDYTLVVHDDPSGGRGRRPAHRHQGRHRPLTTECSSCAPRCRVLRAHWSRASYRRDLNRTLLRVSTCSSGPRCRCLAMVGHLVGLQAQENLPPYLSLAARLEASTRRRCPRRSRTGRWCGS